MTLEDVRKELDEMRKLKMMTELVYNRALRYIENNEGEVEGYLCSLSVSETADHVLDLVRSGCSGGKCD